MFTIKTAFKCSENGCTVDEYSVGEVETLPPLAKAYGLKMGFVEEKATKKTPKKATKTAK